MTNKEIEELIRAHLLKESFKTFQEFIGFHSNPNFLSVCQKSWQKKCLTITCMTCSDNPNSCYCLECFLKGNHENHSFNPRIFHSCNCDCGDPNFIKSTGFCPYHPGSSKNPQDDQLSKDLIQSVQSFSKEIFIKLNSQNHKMIFSILSDLISAGDGMRRCVVLGIAGSISKMINQMAKFDGVFISDLIDLFGQLINDDVFGKLFTESFFLNCFHIFDFLKQSLEDKR
jgi:hypothetical protein